MAHRPKAGVDGDVVTRRDVVDVVCDAADFASAARTFF